MPARRSVTEMLHPPSCRITLQLIQKADQFQRNQLLHGQWVHTHKLFTKLEQVVTLLLRSLSINTDR